MATSDFERFIGGSQDKGINVFEPDLSPEITWDETTVNVTGGIRRGVGPRPGIAPLPGHADTDTLTGQNCNGLMKSESGAGAGLINRELVFACVPINLSPYAGAYPKTSLQYYVWLVGLDYGSDYCLDACLGATLTASVNAQSSSISAGLAESSYREESPLVRKHKTEMLNLPTITTPAAADMKEALKGITGRYWMPTAQMSISGKRVPYQWMIGKVTTVPAVTTAPIVNLWEIPLTGGTSPTVLGGEGSEFETRDAPDHVERIVTFYCLSTTGARVDMVYKKNLTKANTVAQPAYATSTGHYTSLGTATKTGASVAYSSVVVSLVNDPGSFTNSKHEAILIAGERPMAIVYQGWLKAVKGMMPRYVDLSSPGSIPRVLGSTTQGVPSAFPSAVPVACGANTGILRANTTYELGVSLYNKQIDYETNVGSGGQFINGATDFTAVALDSLGAYSVWFLAITGFIHGLPWEWTTTSPAASCEVGRGFHVNDFEYRFYYRESGTQEWLPGGTIDAAKYWFFADWTAIGANTGPAFCTGPSGSLPGGYTNGFIDYSPLPQQRYHCTLAFRGRAFWFAEKSMHFSIAGNIYAYPTRNIVAAQTGQFRGGIVHTQLNMTDQASRLIIFGSNQSYQARFTGNLAQQNVRISSDTVGQFDIEGSDFNMDYLCEATAYSYRAACIAEGVLYFWGPQGVYYDDGNMPMPVKITGSLEPDVFDFVDQTRITEVHSVYNKRTKEVIWFYPPKTADTSFPTYGLVYNVLTDEFSYLKFRFQVDSSQVLKIENDQTTIAISGERIMITGRATAATTNPQRAYFYDELCRGGDQGPGTELMIKTIATPSAGVRRLTLATGSCSIASVQVGDLISIPNAVDYGYPGLDLAAVSPQIATVLVNGTTYLDVTLAAGAAFTAAATLATRFAFPIYHRAAVGAGLHGITWQLQTNYWMPTGVVDQWLWRYLYLLFKYTGWPAPTGQQLTLAYRTLVSGGFLSDTLTLANNSDGQAQIHHPLRNVSAAATGQALKYRLSGIHIGDQWTLEYLEAHCTREKGFTLKQFEG